MNSKAQRLPYLGLFAVLLSCLAFYVSACSGKKVDENNPDALYKDAEESINDKRYMEALEKLKTIKNKFPYSHLATQAKLRIADVYYLQESFVESAGAYESFRDMHPKHEKADYVIFRIGESYFNQLPSSIDRDLGPASKALDAYHELEKLYPKSQYIETAHQHLNEAVDKLASKEKYIADFYFIREMYDSAAKRYEKITTKYANTTTDQYAYWRLGQSLTKLSKIDEARHIYETYLARYPSGPYSKSAVSWLADHK